MGLQHELGRFGTDEMYDATESPTKLNAKVSYRDLELIRLLGLQTKNP